MLYQIQGSLKNKLRCSYTIQETILCEDFDTHSINATYFLPFALGKSKQLPVPLSALS